LLVVVEDTQAPMRTTVEVLAVLVEWCCRLATLTAIKQ